jgi:hypothetical protein
MKESVEDSGKILTLMHKLLKDARLLRSRLIAILLIAMEDCDFWSLTWILGRIVGN